MSVVFPNFGLIGEIDPCSENAIDLINENFKKLDFILAFGVTRVSSLSLTASDGDKELLSTNNVIYYWESGQWNPVDLNIGIVAWDITNENAIMWNGTEWFVLNENTTAVNLGTGFEVFKEKISDELNFRTIIAGDNITITETADSLEIESVLSNNSVTEQKIEDGAVSTPKLQDQAVTPEKIHESYKDRILYLRNPSQVTSNGTIAFFTRTDLTIGKSYEVFIKMRYLTNNTNSPAMNLIHDGVAVGSVNVDANPTSTVILSAADKFVFTATANTVIIQSSNCAAANKIIGDTTVVYRELNSSKLVSSFA